jgi:peptidyl-prolyl cis-trans isomerase SurA
MVYPFENAAYNLEVGAISMPVRSQFGYHLVQLTDRRPASGKVKVRHIFFAAGEEDALEDIQRAERSANEVYRRLQAGERFGQLVNAFSEDRKTNKKGGELPVFGLNEMMPEFEAAAFALKNTGDFSAPVRTSIGFHVIELVEKIPLASYDDLKGSIAQQVKRDSRSTLGAERFLNGIKKAYHLKIDEARYTQALKLVDEKLFLSGEWKIPALKRDYNVVTWDGGTLTQTQLLDLWSTKQKPRTKLALEKYLRDAFEAWVDAALIAYEDQQLESKYPDFKHLVREYKEGILLFDLTQDEVWNKAASDSAGIAQEYELIKNQYKWNDRISFEYWVCKDIRTARKIAKWSNKGKAEKIAALLAKEEALDIVNKKGLSQREDDPVFMDVWSESVGIHGPVTMSNGKYGVLKVMEFIPEEPKQLKEIRGIVIGSYQDRLEQQWIGDLKKKFEVTINGDVAEKVLQKLK